MSAKKRNLQESHHTILAQCLYIGRQTIAELDKLCVLSGEAARKSEFHEVVAHHLAYLAREEGRLRKVLRRPKLIPVYRNAAETLLGIIAESREGFEKLARDFGVPYAD